MPESALRIKKHTKDFDFESVLKDDKTIDAVISNFESNGEAAIRIAPDFSEDNPNIKWKRIWRLRNRFVS